MGRQFAEARGVLFVHWRYCGIPILWIGTSFSPPLHAMKSKNGYRFRNWLKIDDAIRWHELEVLDGRLESQEWVDHLQLRRKEWLEEIKKRECECLEENGK